MSGAPLEQLFRTFLATGDEAALAQLMRRSAPTLRRLARRLGATNDDADDLVQETIVAAIQGAERWDPSRPLLPWLKGILAFRRAKQVRLELRQQRLRTDAANDLAERAAAPPEAVVSEHELHASVHDAIADLPTDYRAPLQQYLFAGRSPVDIARGLGVERATVRVRLHRGIRRLRESLARWVALLVAVLLGRRASAAAPRPFVTAAVWSGLVVAAVVAVAGSRDEPAPTDGSATTAAPAAAALVPAADPTPTTLASERTAATDEARSRLVVRVVDAGGRGVPHVGVALEPCAGADPVLHRRRAVTGERGEVVFERLLPGAFRAATDRGVSAEVVVHAGANERALTVAAGRAVRGRVVDGEGTAVPGAAVWLSGDTSGPWRGDDVVVTDGAGRFGLSHVPDGAFLAARHPAFAGSAVVRLDTSARIDDVELRLGPGGGTAEVAVFDVDGTPCTDALVVVGESMDMAPFVLADGAAPWREPPFERRTGTDGTVRCGALAPGRHPVFVRAAGRAPWAGHVEVGRAGGPRVVARLQPGGRVVGRVVDADDRAIADALVVFRGDEPGHGIDVRSATDGTFAFECVPLGEAQVAARADGRVPAVASVDVVAGRDTAPRLVLRAARSLRGTLDVASAGALPRTAVRATWPRAALLAWQVVGEAANGAFTIAAECEGRPSLEVRFAGEPMWRPVDAFVTWRNDDATVRLPAGFVADAWLTGVARDAAGAPLAATRVFVHRDGVQWAEVGRTADDGTFRVGPLPAATYDLFFETTLESVPTAWTNGITVGAGETREVRFDAPPTGVVDLEFVRADGAAVGELAITIVGTAPERRALMATAPHVRQRLLAGDYRVFVMGEHVQWLEAMPLRVTAGATRTQRVELLPARRCVLAVRGLPRPRGEAFTLRLLDRGRGDRVTTFTLLPDAPERLTAMLASGDHVLECDGANGIVWSGAFHVDAAATDGWSIPVHLAPRIR